MSKPLEEWEHHIEHTHEFLKKKIFWCGAPWEREWSFTSLDHAAYTMLRGDRLQPCEGCVAAATAALQGKPLPATQPCAGYVGESGYPGSPCVRCFRFRKDHPL